MSVKYFLHNANSERVMRVLKHLGPDQHPSGSSQDVHGSNGTALDKQDGYLGSEYKPVPGINGLTAKVKNYKDRYMVFFKLNGKPYGSKIIDVNTNSEVVDAASTAEKYYE